VGNDGGRVGAVKEVGQHYVLISPGDLYVPASAIANVQESLVQLNVARPDVAQMGWEQPPRSDDVLQTGPEPDEQRHV
jgi:hypothetical protein